MVRLSVQLIVVLMLGVLLTACPATAPANTDGPESTGGGNGQGTDETGGPEASLVALHGGALGLMPFVEVGSCFWVLASVPDLTNVVEIVSCDEEHQYEMFGKITLTEETYPGEDAMGGLTTGCEDQLFEDYVGEPFDGSEWGILAVGPTESEWAAGQRTIQCALFDPDSDTTEGSVTDSGD